MVECPVEAPLKILIIDLRNFKKRESKWTYTISEKHVAVNINKIIIQGEIIKTAGFNNEILLIDDGTGKAKVTRGPQVPGDLSWINAGVHCSIVGSLLDNGKLPLIMAEKIAKITNQILQEMWPWEVKEIKNVIAEKIFPRLEADNDILALAFCEFNTLYDGSRCYINMVTAFTFTSKLTYSDGFHLLRDLLKRETISEARKNI